MVKIVVLCIIALSYVSSSYGNVAASRSKLAHLNHILYIKSNFGIQFVII